MSTPEQIAAGFAKAAEAAAKPDELIQRIVLIAEGNAKQRTPVATGNLRRSITSRVETPQRGLIGTAVEYARFVHEGTSRMEPRPFLEEGIEDSQGAIQQELEKFGGGVLELVGK